MAGELDGARGGVCADTERNECTLDLRQLARPLAGGGGSSSVACYCRSMYTGSLFLFIHSTNVSEAGTSESI